MIIDITIMNTSKTFSKLTIADKVINIQIQWVSNEQEIFSIQLCEGKNMWTGVFSKESLEYYREELDQSEIEYLSEVRQALGENSKDFEYSLQCENNVSIFKWMKKFVINEKPVVRIHGKLKLQHTEVTTDVAQDSLLDNLMKDNKDLRISNESYKEENNKLKAELENYKKLLEDFVNNEKNLESMLYSKFVQVLNEKKKRIQLLEEHINKFEN